jgi:hypothetical protein
LILTIFKKVMPNVESFGDKRYVSKGRGVNFCCSGNRCWAIPELRSPKKFPGAVQGVEFSGIKTFQP